MREDSEPAAESGSATARGAGCGGADTRGGDPEASMVTVRTLDELATVVEGSDPGEDLYVRWSHGPSADVASGDGTEQRSQDALTGVLLPGLSANPLRVEPWWEDRSTRLWLARRLYDYRHLREMRGPGVRAWVLVGEEQGRGPDNEPLVTCRRPVAWIAESALRECEQMIADEDPGEWGPLDRRG